MQKSNNILGSIVYVLWTKNHHWNKNTHKKNRMKCAKISIVLVAIFFSSLVQAQVNFVNQSWEQILSKAKSENKLVYLDAYTDWCGWCKVLDKETFSNPQVGDFMNRNFVSTKLEMEKSEMGKKIAMKYVVNSFPSGLIFNGDGNLVYTIAGYSPPKDFMNLLKEAILPPNQWNLKGYSNGFTANYPNFYLKAMGANGKKEFPADSVVNNYLRNQEDKFAETSWVVWKRFSYALDESNKKFFLLNRTEFSDKFGKVMVEDILSSFIQKKVELAAKNKDEKMFDAAMKEMSEQISNAEENKPWYQLYFYEHSGDWKRFGTKANELITTKPDFASSSINAYAWSIYESCNDLETINLAISWMDKVVKTEAEYDYLDTYAALLYKVKNYPEAERYALQAIEVGKVQNRKVGDTQKLLEKIQDNMSRRK
jgi:thioredoxin-related protein